jgi:hypothetical protein
MPTLTFNIPRGTQTFAARARRKAGMGAFFAKVPTPPLPANGAFSRGLSSYFSRPGGSLPPPGIFSQVAVGMNSFFSDPINRPLPAPGVFAPLARGMRSFFMRPAQAPPLPAPSVFAGYASAHDCQTCRKRCFRRRGMGQDNGAPTFSVPSDLGNLSFQLNETAPTVSVPSDLGTSLILPSTPTTSPFTLSPSSNPSLDAYNQALSNAAATNPALTSVSNLAKMGSAVAAATPAQLQTATAALNAQAAASPSFTQTITNWLAASTVISGVSNSTVAFGGAAAIVLLAALASKKKGKR